MITLYEVIPGPQGEFGLYGRLSVLSHDYETWHSEQAGAEAEARRLCVALLNDGKLDRPGNKVIVVAMDFASIENLARGRCVKDSRRVVRVDHGSRLANKTTGDWRSCNCVTDCDDDPASACSLSGQLHVHPQDDLGRFGPCLVHPDAPGDL